MKELLRFLTCGSVDDGKSTLIGRLLYDADLLTSDQRQELDSAAAAGDGELDFSSLLDGLTDERQQGITIDVAYRFFTTDRRSFIVADTPGHEQYTRNMAVGASFADLAVLLIDSERGIRTQTWRHARICRMMGIRHFIFAVNKMDLLGYSQEAFAVLESQLWDLSDQLDLPDVSIIPVSAARGDNVVDPSSAMDWYDGPTLLARLHEADVSRTGEDEAFVLPVQRVCRPDGDYRGYEGQIASGTVSCGDMVYSVQSRESAQVRSILRAGEEAASAFAGDPVSITLDREIDIARGDVLAGGGPLRLTDTFERKIVWMEDEPLSLTQLYYLKLGTHTVPVSVSEIRYLEDPATGEQTEVSEITKNQIARVVLKASRKLACSLFDELPEMGRFLLINRVSLQTSACGVVEYIPSRGLNLTWQKSDLTRQDRSGSLGQKPVTVWMTGLSGSGKSSLANAAEGLLHAMGRHTMILDGDNVRMGLNSDLSFSGEDRGENIRRIAEVARLMNDAGLIVLTAFISPYIIDRAKAKAIIGEDAFFEVHVNTPLEVCEERDVKGLYSRARNGEIEEFTGISSPYEEPDDADFTIDTSTCSIEEAARRLVEALENRKEKQHG